jgi:hypothetical protein
MTKKSVIVLSTRDHQSHKTVVLIILVLNLGYSEFSEINTFTPKVFQSLAYP